MKKGLVLEGGAMRGLFSEGIFDILLENGINFDGMAGVSAGAVFGCNFKSRQIGRALRYNKRYCKDKRYCSFRSWLLTGNLFGTDFCYRELPEKLDKFDAETFEKNPLEFYLVCTDVESGKAVYKQCSKVDEKCFEWMRASASMPLVSKMVEIDGHRYLDGAIADSIPLEFFESIGYDRNIVILTQCENYVKKASSMQNLMRIVYRKYPEFVRALEHRHIMYNKQVKYIEKQAEAGKIMLLRPPSPLPVKRVCCEADLLQQTYDAGRRLALAKLEEIKNFLCC